MRWMMLGLALALALAAGACGREGELERPAAFSAQLRH